MNKAHLKIWSEAVKALDLANGITLCAKHHYELHIKEATDPDHIVFYQKLLKDAKSKEKRWQSKIDKQKNKKKKFTPRTILRKKVK